MRIDVDDFYRRFAGLVFRRCSHLLKDEVKARDAMHDVFLRVGLSVSGVRKRLRLLRKQVKALEELS